MPHGWRAQAYRLLDQTVEGDRLARLVHGALVALILVNVACVVLESEPAIGERFRRLFLAVEIGSIAVFTLEYAARVWAAPEHPPWRGLPSWRARLTYVTTPGAVIDLLAVLPMLLLVFDTIDLRALLVVRLLRFFKLARYSPGMASLLNAVREERRSLLACLVILMGAVLIFASLMHMAEADAQPDRFGSIPRAMYWALITLTTVGYGDAVPSTALGQALASVTAIVGLVMLALPVGIIASAFAREINDRDFVVTWSMVTRVPVLAELDAAAVAEVMRALRSRTVEADELVLAPEAEDPCIFFVATGEVEVDGPGGAQRLQSNDFFGEVSPGGTKRLGAVRAVRHTKLLVLDAHDLAAVLRRHPEIERKVRAAMAREGGRAESARP